MVTTIMGWPMSEDLATSGPGSDGKGTWRLARQCNFSGADSRGCVWTRREQCTHHRGLKRLIQRTRPVSPLECISKHSGQRSLAVLWPYRGSRPRLGDQGPVVPDFRWALEW